MLNAVISPLGMEASSLTTAQQQCPSCPHLQINFPIRTWLKKQNILELKSYREQCRSLNFLSFISKKVKNYPRFLGISTIFSKQMPQRERNSKSESEQASERASVKEREREHMWAKKERGWVKSTYLPKNATFYNLLYVQGEGHIFCQRGVNFKDE